MLKKGKLQKLVKQLRLVAQQRENLNRRLNGLRYEYYVIEDFVKDFFIIQKTFFQHTIKFHHWRLLVIGNRNFV